MSEMFQACFACSNDFILSQKSLGFSGRIIVEIHEAVIFGITPISKSEASSSNLSKSSLFLIIKNL